MLFNSLEFLIFFPVVTIGYFLLPYSWRWLWLLIASCVFYMALIPVYILILFFTIIIDYYAGIWIEGAEGKRRLHFLWLSVAANVGVLAVFKYYNFFVENVNSLIGMSGAEANLPYWDIILPVGLSFHTFQAMSYTIEVYRGNQKAERHLGIYSLYVMFYPQLVAGPIERPQNVIHQFYEKHDFNYDNAAQGLQLMLWGLFKKIVVADRLSIYVNAVFDNPEAYQGWPLVFGAIFFTIQVYCDFSGYSDVALGSAKVMGFTLMKNFNQPYMATSISDFWRRWHISLSTWFTDYLHTKIAMQLREWGKMAVVTAILLTFLTSGLWHGPAWHFVLWGGLYGAALCIEYLTKKDRKKWSKKIGEKVFNFGGWIAVMIITHLFYIVFRVNNTEDLVHYFSNLFNFDANLIGVPIISRANFLLMLVLVAFVYFSDFWIENGLSGKLPKVQGVNYTYIANALMVILIFVLGVFEQQSFIYFQF